MSENQGIGSNSNGDINRQPYPLNTQGYCFMCIEKGDGVDADNTGLTSVSLHTTISYLKVDLGKVLKLAGVPSPSCSNLQERTEIFVSLCGDCRTDVETLEKVAEEEDRIQIKKAACLGRIRGHVQEPERDQTRKQEWTHSMINAIESAIHLRMVEELRGEVSQKCQGLASENSSSTGSVDNGLNTEENSTPPGSSSSMADATTEVVGMPSEEEGGMAGAPQSPDGAAGVGHGFPSPAEPDQSPSVLGKTCFTCGDTFKYPSGLKRHLQRTGHQSGAPACSPPLLPSSTSVEVLVCNVDESPIPESGDQAVPSEDPLRLPNDSQRDSSEPLAPVLPRSVVMEPGLIGGAGSTRNSTGKRRYRCESCKRRFSSHRYLTTEHRPNCNGEPRWAPGSLLYECKICRKGFSKKRTFATHCRDRVCVPNNGFKCDICERMLKTQKSLKVHRDTVHLGRRFPCTVAGCNKSYGSKQALKKHSRTHPEGNGDGEEEILPSLPSTSQEEAEAEHWLNQNNLFRIDNK